MGFDNECIPNIQTLAGEYFCPVCRLLVYPNEAIQSQCTHLYCKPCLTYTVGTSRACPYDGYLVTEADSKPLIESNPALAETIGRITVHCLYHRSGCTWLGPLSECTSHCSGCAFGNSPVVCNRCGVQIVHRQVQEHAQNCPGVQPQAQHAEGGQNASTTGTGATGDQTQPTTQAGATIPQAQTSQSTISSMPGQDSRQDSSQQANATAQTQGVALAAVPTAEQWFQQQQQYQQYYQQYPGYDPYQQHYQQYYPYQQQGISQQQQPQVYLQPQASQVQMQPQLQVQPQASQLQTQPQSQAQAQSLQHIQPTVAAQPQNQVQVNSQQQIRSNVQLQSQIQLQAHPPPHGHPPPQAQPNPQTNPLQAQPPVQVTQYQQPHSQMQHPQPQVQAQAHSQFLTQQHAAPQPHSQALPQTPAQHHLQPLSQPHTSQPNQPVNPNLQPQGQHPSAHAVTGYHSYTQQPPPLQQMQGAPQHPVHIHPQGGPPQLQSQQPIQIQSQFPQHPAQLRPSQSHATSQNQQQPGLLPLPGQVPSVPLAQQQPLLSHAHQLVLPGHQRPAMPPVQQPMQPQYVQHQQPFSGQTLGPVQSQVQQQQPLVQPQLHPQGPVQSFQQPSQAYPQPPQNAALAHGLQPHQAQNVAGRPMLPLQGIPTQPHPQSAVGMQVRTVQVGAIQQSGNIPSMSNQVLLSSEQQSRATSRPMSDRQGNHVVEKGAEAESTGERNAKKDPSSLDQASGLGADGSGLKTIKSESDLKPVDDENKPIGEGKSISESLAAENGEPLIKKVKEEPLGGTDYQKDVSGVDCKQVELSLSEDREGKDGPLLKAPPLQEEQSMKSQKDQNLTKVSGDFLVHGQAQGGGLVQHPPSVPVVDQGNQQLALNRYGPSSLQQRPVGQALLPALPPGPPHHTQLPGHAPSHLRPLGPGNIHHPGQPLNPLPEHIQQPVFKQPLGPEISPAGIPGPGSVSIFGRGPSHYGPTQVPYTHGHAPLQGERAPLYGHDAEMFPTPRPNFTDGRQTGTLGQHSNMQSSVMRMNVARGPDSSPATGVRDDKLRAFPDDHLNPLSHDPARRTFDRGEFEEDLKHFPRPSPLETEPVSKFGNHFSSSGPLDRGPHGFGMDVPPRPLEKGPHGMKLESLGSSAPSRFFPPYHNDGTLPPTDVGERPFGFRENIVGRSNSARTHPDFLGPASGYGHRPMDGLAPRSPGRDYPGLPAHGIGALPGRDNIDGRESRRFGDPISSSFHDSRFSMLPSHLRGDEFEGPGNLRMSEHLRSGDLIGQDGPPNHLRRGERLGPHNLHGHLQMGEPVGFGAFPGHARMGELAGPGNFRSPRLGEPGFRSSFSLKGFPSDGGNYAGDFESFDNSRKRKPSSMGWCRICKVDCETVERLDLHSQTREHQKMAMDMVQNIKKNAKKQKLVHGGHSSLDDSSKSRNASSEDRGNKH